MTPLQVLLIDDDEDSFLIARGLLAQVKGASYELQWVDSYEAGLEVLRLERHDACLLDYRLGARTGLELLQQAVAQGCRTPIIMLTGQSDHEVDLQAMKAGAADFLDKDRLDASRLERSLRYTVERQHLMTALKNSEARFRRLFEANIIGVFFAESNGEITNANDAFMNIIGYDRNDLPIHWDRQLKIAEPQFLDEAGLQQLKTAGVANPREQNYRHKTGRPVPVLIGAALLEGHSDQCVCFAVDMTERDRLRELLDQNERLAAIGMLSAGIAHEINNPLSFVANNLAILKRDVVGLRDLIVLYDTVSKAVPDEFGETLGQIEEIKSEIEWEYVEANLGRLLDSTQEGVRRITRIIQNLRAIASRDLSVTEDASLPALITASLDVLETRLVKAGIRVEVDHQPMPLARCCPTQIIQVLVNLISNSIAAIESRDVKEPGSIRISSRRVGDQLTVEIKDNGCGIAPEDLPHIYDPFFTRMAVGAGMGLGLSLGHRIMTDHGGSITVESRPGKGSCFTIGLPLRTSATADAHDGLSPKLAP